MKIGIVGASPKTHQNRSTYIWKTKTFWINSELVNLSSEPLHQNIWVFQSWENWKQWPRLTNPWNSCFIGVLHFCHRSLWYNCKTPHSERCHEANVLARFGYQTFVWIYWIYWVYWIYMVVILYCIILIAIHPSQSSWSSCINIILVLILTFHVYDMCFTLLGTNISHRKALLKMILLFCR